MTDELAVHDESNSFTQNEVSLDLVYDCARFRVDLFTGCKYCDRKTPRDENKTSFRAGGVDDVVVLDLPW